MSRRRALSLVEVMLALAILSIGVITGLELMARVVHSGHQINATATWEERAWAARQALWQMSTSDIAQRLALGGGSFTLQDIRVKINHSAAPHPDYPQALALDLQVLDDAAGVIAQLPMLHSPPSPQTP